LSDKSFFRRSEKRLLISTQATGLTHELVSTVWSFLVRKEEQVVRGPLTLHRLIDSLSYVRQLLSFESDS
jgi:hypothetical protein